MHLIVTDHNTREKKNLLCWLCWLFWFHYVNVTFWRYAIMEMDGRTPRSSHACFLCFCLIRSSKLLKVDDWRDLWQHINLTYSIYTYMYKLFGYFAILSVAVANLTKGETIVYQRMEQLTTWNRLFQGCFRLIWDMCADYLIQNFTERLEQLKFCRFEAYLIWQKKKWYQCPWNTWHLHKVPVLVYLWRYFKHSSWVKSKAYFLFQILNLIL